MIVREEALGDSDGVRTVVETAFRDMPFSSQTEHRIVDAMRDADALTLSLLAVEDNGTVVGHVAFSTVEINGDDMGWYGLGPVAVLPGRQRVGIGSALILNGLDRLRKLSAAGCVVVGDSRYYRRFGFVPEPGLVYDGAPAEYFMAISFGGKVPTGEVTFHPAFSIA